MGFGRCSWSETRSSLGAMTDMPVITVRGEATGEGPPDLATLSITVQAQGPSAEKVRAALAADVARCQDLLAEFDDAIEERSTGGFHFSPVFDRRGERKAVGRPGVRHFTGSVTTTVVVRDFDALSPIVIALGAIPQSQVNGPNWSLRRDNPLHAEARLAAIDDALRRVRDYAAAFGATVADLVEISDLEPGPQLFAHARATRMMSTSDEPPSFDFEPPLQTVPAQITVRCTITAPDLSP